MVTANPELFVNDGNPAPLTNNPNTLALGSVTYYPEYLYLVNGEDDNGDGFVDNGWDGFDNNYNGLVDEIGEWNSPWRVRSRNSLVPSTRSWRTKPPNGVWMA